MTLCTHLINTTIPLSSFRLSITKTLTSLKNGTSNPVHHRGFHLITLMVTSLHVHHKMVGIYRCLYNFTAQLHNDLTICSGDIIRVTKQVNSDWMHGVCNGKHGQFPCNYVEQVLQRYVLICQYVVRPPPKKPVLPPPTAP